MDTPETLQTIVQYKTDVDSSVYTPWKVAFEELERRRSNPTLQDYVTTSLQHGIPEVMQDKKSIVLFRHIATPNYEISRFLACADAFDDFKSLILEYTDDQFNDRNQWKYFLGKLRFHKGVNKKGEPVYENVNIINFNESNNMRLSDIKTHWGQSLVDFHHEMFNDRFKNSTEGFYDLSKWLHAYGTAAKDYYKAFLTLFLKDAILFDNIRSDIKELAFTESIILPALVSIEKECGLKPLIVMLAPTEMEADEFWYSHPHTRKATVDKKLGG